MPQPILNMRCEHCAGDLALVEGKAVFCFKCGRTSYAALLMPVARNPLKWRVRFKFDLRDIWIGVYIQPVEIPPPISWRFYVCLLPCCVIVIEQVKWEMK